MPEKHFFSLEFRLPQYMEVLPRVLDRCEASRYFLIHADEIPNRKEAHWYARASLNEFKSAIDLIGQDMRALSLNTEWQQSDERRNLSDNLIIKMISCCRNLSFHTGTVITNTKEGTIRIIGPEGSHLSTLKALFIDGIRNQVAGARLRLTSNELNEISEIVDSIPLFMILAESYKIVHISLENFLLDHDKLDNTKCEQFWNRFAD